MANEVGHIHTAILDAMAEIDAISKDKRNSQQGFNFRGIDDVYNSLHPILAKNRIFSVPEVIAERHEDRTTKKGAELIYRVLTIRYTFYTDDGSSVSGTVMGEGMDSGDKASNKAMAVAHKYALLQMFCIPTEDMIDPDSETLPESTPIKEALAHRALPTMTKGREEIEKLLERFAPMLPDASLDAARMDMDAAKDVDALRTIYLSLKQQGEAVEREEQKARTKKSFDESAKNHAKKHDTMELADEAEPELPDSEGEAELF